jgi:hypothetical protein
VTKETTASNTTDLGFFVRQRNPQIVTIVGQLILPNGEYINAFNNTGLWTQCKYQKPNTNPIIAKIRLTGLEFSRSKFSFLLKYAFSMSRKNIAKIIILGTIMYFTEITVAQSDRKAINKKNKTFLIFLNINPNIMTAKNSICIIIEYIFTWLVIIVSQMAISWGVFIKVMLKIAMSNNPRKPHLILFFIVFPPF